MPWHTHDLALDKRCPTEAGELRLMRTDADSAIAPYTRNYCVGPLCMAWRKHPHGPEGYCGLAGEPK